MSRIRKKHLGVIPGVLALLALIGAWILPFNSASAEGGSFQASASSECVEGQPILTFTFSGYTPVTPASDNNNVKVFVDGGGSPVYDGDFDDHYTDSVNLGDPLVSHSWRVEVTSWDTSEGDKTLTGTSEPCVSDDDGDGVPNGSDQCPGTPSGEPVDADGCSNSQLDDDGDGVPNGSDQCPNQAGPADNDGCPVVEPPADSDGDGVPNADDQCPGTPAGEPVDADGCSDSQKDSDDDGVNDDVDQCPGTPPGTDVDENGCAVEEPPADDQTHVKQSSLQQHYGDCDGNNVSGQLNVTDPEGVTLESVTLSDGTVLGPNDVTYKSQGNVLQITVPLADGVYIVDAVINHPEDWSGQFVLSHYTCGEDEEEPSGSSDFVVSCESLVINEPKDVMPADSEYQYFLDGEAITVGSHELAAGDYTLTLEVDGTEVDSDTFTVEECDEPQPATPTVSVTVDGCVEPGETTAASGEITNVDDETDEAVDYDWSVTLTGDDQVVDSGSVQDVADGDSAPFTVEGLAPGDYTVTVEGSDGTTASNTFTVEECDNPPTEEPNTYSATSTCDRFDPQDPDQLSNGTISATVNNTDDATDAPLEGYTAEVYFKTGDGETLAFEPKAFGSVADGQSATVTFEHANGGATYIVKILDGADKVVFEKTVDVEFCDTEPPGEGDVDIVPVCGAVKVTNNEDSTGQFFYGSFDEIEPDGIVSVKPGETVKVKTDRKSLDWVMVWDDGKYTQGENLKVDQKCGNTPDNPDNPDNPDDPDQPTWPHTPDYGVPETGATLTGSDSGNGWPLMLFGAGGLAAMGLTLRIRKIKVMSR